MRLRRRVPLLALFAAIALVAPLLMIGSRGGPAAASPFASAKGTIVFSSGRDPPGIYVMRADGSRVRRLERNSKSGETPAWSPNGRQVAFASDRAHPSFFSIYVVNADGSGLRRLTRQPNRTDMSPSWSPDGRRIAFESRPRVGTGVSVIEVVNTDGRGLRGLARPGESPAWSPSGQGIAFTRHAAGEYSQIWLVNPDGSGLRQLTRNRVDHADPAWSPAGRRIAFSGSGDALYDQIWLVNVHGTGLRRLTHNRLNHYWPDWSPDGRRIAFTGNPSADLVGGSPWNVYVIDASGHGQRRLTRTGDEINADWSTRKPS